MLDPIIEANLEIEVKEMVINGWPATRIFRHLRSNYQIDCPLSVIADHISRVPESDRLPPAGLDKRHHAEVRIDPLQEMQRILREQGIRVEAALTVEDVSNASATSVSHIARDELQAYFKMLQDYVSTAQSLGQLTRTPEEVHAFLRSSSGPTLEELKNARMGPVLGAARGSQKLIEDGTANDPYVEDVEPEAAGIDEDSGSRVGPGEHTSGAEVVIPRSSSDSLRLLANCDLTGPASSDGEP